MDLVEVFHRDFVAGRFYSVIVSRQEALEMSLGPIRKQVREAREVLAAAKMVGDKASVVVAQAALEARTRELAVAVLRENGLGVPKADESARESEVLPKGVPRKG